MLKVVLEAAGSSTFEPFMLLLLLAPIAIVLAVFLVRFRRKGDK